MPTVPELIDRLKLQPLPGEGGFFRQIRQTAMRVPTPRGPRPAGTTILYLVTADNCSALHRLPSSEAYTFHAGDPLDLFIGSPDGRAGVHRLGPIENPKCTPAVDVPPGHWQGSRITPGGSWALLTCSLSPGWDPADFELGRRTDLLRDFPAHREMIVALTRD